MASGINNTFRQVGIATGIAGLGAIFQHSVSPRTMAALARSGQPHAVLRATHGQLGTRSRRAKPPSSPARLGRRARGARHSFHVGFTGALTTILLIAAAIALVGAVLAFVLVRSRDFVSAAEAPATPAADTQSAEPVAAAAG